MNEREKELRWIWTDGYDAYREHALYDCELLPNPYEEHTDEFRAWNDGVQAAREEFGQ